MTILFFSRLFYPHIGGVEKHVLEVGKVLVKQGHTVVVVTEALSKSNTSASQSSNKSDKEEGIIEGIEVVRIPLGKADRFKKLHIWRWLFAHRDLITAADIIHCHDVFFWYMPFRFLYSKKSVYTTFHGYETVFPPSDNAILMRKLSEKLSSGNICVGQFITKWYGTKPTYITYGGINRDKKNTQKKDAQHKKLQIVFVGRFEEDTGVPIYLQVLTLLQKKKIAFNFLALGRGTLEKGLKNYGVARQVADITPFIQSADIIFASSYLAILESLMYKKPVFATYDNALKKDYLIMSPFARWVTIENNPEMLVNGIQSHENRGAKIAEGYNWAKTQTWEQVTSLYTQLWKI